MPPRGPLAHLARWRQRGKDNIKPDGMDWSAKSHLHHHHPGVIT